MSEPWVDSYELFADYRKLYKERNDCTVIAFAVALNTTYGKAHKHMQIVYGRQKGRGVYIREHPNIGLNKTKHKIGPYTQENRISVANFAKKHTQGRYYCLSRGHAFAIIDGVVWDHTYRPRAQITHAVRIYLED